MSKVWRHQRVPSCGRARAGNVGIRRWRVTLHRRGPAIKLLWYPHLRWMLNEVWRRRVLRRAGYGIPERRRWQARDPGRANRLSRRRLQRRSSPRRRGGRQADGRKVVHGRHASRRDLRMRRYWCAGSCRPALIGRGNGGRTLDGRDPPQRAAGVRERGGRLRSTLPGRLLPRLRRP